VPKYVVNREAIDTALVRAKLDRYAHRLEG